MAATRPQIGWYGLGSMGRLMAENLQKHLASSKDERPLIYNNRTIESGANLNSLGAVAAKDFASVVAQCDIVFTMVSNDRVLEDLIQLAVGEKESVRDTIFVDCSTIHPDTSEKISSTLAAHQATFLSAPVFGGPAIAATGKIVVAIGGPSKASATVQPYMLDVVCRKIINCGEEARSAALLKIGGNIVTLVLMEAVGEAQVFAEKTGLGTGPMQDLITDAIGPVAGGYSQRLTSGIYAPSLDTRPGFGVSLSVKDATHALSIASDKDFKLPGLELANSNMKAAREYAGECLDASSMYGVLRQDAGLEFWNDKSRQKNE